jgi:hypothetical protein
MTKLARFLACAALTVATLVSASADDCTLQKFASLDITPFSQPNGYMTVPVFIGAKEHPFVLSLASPYSAVSESVVQEVGAEQRPLPSGVAAFLFGQRVTREAVLPDVEFGSAHGSAAVLVVPKVPPDADGWLGTDLLSKFDMEFDLRHKKLNLFSQDHCSGRVVYWGGIYAVVPILKDDFGAIYFDMVLDGKHVNVGINTQFVSAQMGESDFRDLFGIDPSTAGYDVMKPGESVVDVHKFYPFKTLSVGGVTIANPKIFLAAQKPSQQCRGTGAVGSRCYSERQLYIGLDQLDALHMYFAFSERKLYVTAARAE